MFKLLKYISIIIILGSVVFLGIVFLQHRQINQNGTPQPFNQTVRDFIPFDIGIFSSGSENIIPEEPSGNQNQGVTSEDGKLTRISNRPSIGYTILSDETVRYVERSNGAIYEIKNNTERRLSDTIIPGVGEALFFDNGTAVALRFTKDDNQTIETYVSPVPNNESPLPLQGVFLPQNIRSVTAAGSRLITLIQGTQSTTAYSYDRTGKRISLFSHPFSEWNIQAVGNTVFLNTKPASGIEGFMYAKTNTGSLFTKVLGNITGLTTLINPNASLVLFSDDRAELSLYRIASRTTELYGLRTLPEKCAWQTNTIVYCLVPRSTPAEGLPDSWYQGRVSFSDSLWLLNTTTNVFSFIEEFPGVDGIHPQVTARYFYFIDKQSGDLYRYEL